MKTMSFIRLCQRCPDNRVHELHNPHIDSCRFKLFQLQTDLFGNGAPEFVTNRKAFGCCDCGCDEFAGGGASGCCTRDGSFSSARCMFHRSVLATRFLESAVELAHSDLLVHLQPRQRVCIYAVNSKLAGSEGSQTIRGTAENSTTGLILRRKQGLTTGSVGSGSHGTWHRASRSSTVRASSFFIRPPLGVRSPSFPF